MDQEDKKEFEKSLNELEQSIDQNKIEVKETCSTTKSRRFNIKPFCLTDQEIMEANNEPLKSNPTIYSTVEESDSDLDESRGGSLRATNKKCDTILEALEDKTTTVKPDNEFVAPLPPPLIKKPEPVYNMFVTPPLHSEYPKTEEEEMVDMKDIIQNRSILPDSFVPSVERSTGSRGDGQNVHDSSPSNPIFEKIEVNMVSYVILNTLGKGGSSVVHRCYDVLAKTECAIKVVDISEEELSRSFINEVKLLERLQDCNRIIKMYDYEIINSRKKLLVVLEIGRSDFSQILKKINMQHAHLPTHVLIYYWMEMLYAVQQIHEKGIVHNDLKPANFLKVDDGLKLIDFGIANTVPDNMTSAIKDVQIGSLNYISPEALINYHPDADVSRLSDIDQEKPAYKVSYKSDVWSLGCILYQLVYHKAPFQQYGNKLIKLSKLIDKKHKIAYPESDWIPKKILGTIKSCLQFEKDLRPSVRELIQDYENIFNNC